MQASYFDKTAPIARRRKLVKLTRRALTQWGKACDVLGQVQTALSYDEEQADAARRRANHLIGRYCKLEQVLADEAKVSTTAVFNALQRFPICPLLVANL